MIKTIETYRDIYEVIHIDLLIDIYIHKDMHIYKNI